MHQLRTPNLVSSECELLMNHNSLVTHPVQRHGISLRLFGLINSLISVANQSRSHHYLLLLHSVQRHGISSRCCEFRVLTSSSCLAIWDLFESVQTLIQSVLMLKLVAHVWKLHNKTTGYRCPIEFGMTKRIGGSCV